MSKDSQPGQSSNSQEKEDLVHILGNGWPDASYSRVWMTVFNVIAEKPEELPDAWFIDVGGDRVCMFDGQLEYGAVDSIDFRRRGGGVECRVSGATKKLPRSLYLIIMTPMGRESDPDTEYRPQTQVSILAGLVGAVCGPNAAFRRVFDNVLDLDTYTLAAHSPVYRNPQPWEPTDVSPKKLADVGRAYEKLTKVESTRLTVHRNGSTPDIALRWVEVGPRCQ